MHTARCPDTTPCASLCRSACCLLLLPPCEGVLRFAGLGSFSVLVKTTSDWPDGLAKTVTHCRSFLEGVEGVEACRRARSGRRAEKALEGSVLWPCRPGQGLLVLLSADR